MIRHIFLSTDNITLENLGEWRALISKSLSRYNMPGKIISNIVLCFSEIATNCVEHGNSQHIKVDIWQKEGTLNLTLQDDGEELSQELIHKSPDVFDLTQESGRGIAIVHTLCDSFTHSIRIESSNGLNWKNCFELSWNARSFNEPDSILLIDDDPSLLALYEAYLGSTYRILKTTSANEAIDIIAKAPPDLIISDINMPEMSGIELREKIHQNKKGQLIPFIFLTMEENTTVARLAQRSNIDDFLLKPISKSALMDTCDRVITHHRALKKSLLGELGLQTINSLLCKIPDEYHHWKFACDSRNVGAGGGDFVMFFPTKQSSYLVIADVMGHDISSKFFAHAYFGFIKGLLLANNEICPSEILSQISQQIFHDDLFAQSGLTLCALKLNENGKVTIASAGHPTPWLISTEATLKAIPCSGMMPGLRPEQSYKTIDITLNKGERIALYSDGLFEGANEESVRQTLQKDIPDALQSSIQQSIGDSLALTMKTFDSQVNLRPTDDALLLLLERSTTS